MPLEIDRLTHILTEGLAQAFRSKMKPLHLIIDDFIVLMPNDIKLITGSDEIRAIESGYSNPNDIPLIYASLFVAITKLMINLQQAQMFVEIYDRKTKATDLKALMLVLLSKDEWKRLLGYQAEDKCIHVFFDLSNEKYAREIIFPLELILINLHSAEIKLEEVRNLSLTFRYHSLLASLPAKSIGNSILSDRTFIKFLSRVDPTGNMRVAALTQNNYRMFADVWIYCQNEIVEHMTMLLKKNSMNLRQIIIDSSVIGHLCSSLYTKHQLSDDERQKRIIRLLDVLTEQDRADVVFELFVRCKFNDFKFVFDGLSPARAEQYVLLLVHMLQSMKPVPDRNKNDKRLPSSKIKLDLLVIPISLAAFENDYPLESITLSALSLLMDEYFAKNYKTREQSDLILL